MTAKKRAQGGLKGKVTREQLKARASEIIDDTVTYDADTRVRVSVALQNLRFYESGGTPGIETSAEAARKARKFETELAGLCRRAEAGESLADFSGVDEETVRQVWTVFELVEKSNGCPQFIYEALMTAIDEAARLAGLPVWKYTDEEDQLASGGYSPRVMATLFERFMGEAVPLEPKRDLADLISGVLTHRDTPTRVYNALSEAVSELASKDEVQNRPEVIRAALAVHGAEEKGGDE
jgi:hypothetical protein